MTNHARQPHTPRAARPLARTLALAIAASALSAAQAFAQSGGPPRPQAVDSPPSWLYYIVVGLLIAATVGASLLPSKRGHLD